MKYIIIPGFRRDYLRPVPEFPTFRTAKVKFGHVQDSPQKAEFVVNHLAFFLVRAELKFNVKVVRFESVTTIASPRLAGLGSYSTIKGIVLSRTKMVSE